MTKTNVQLTPSNSQRHDTPTQNAHHQVPCDSGGKKRHWNSLANS